MSPLVRTFFAFLTTCFRSRASLQMENAMLRHQLHVYQRRQPQPKLRPMDRFLWAWVSRTWPGWREALKVVKPATVTAWPRDRSQRAPPETNHHKLLRVLPSVENSPRSRDGHTAGTGCSNSCSRQGYRSSGSRWSTSSLSKTCSVRSDT